MEGLERPPWNPARQCTATNRAGERCQRQPIPGGFVCVNHGGKIPAVQQSAKARLLAGADLAIDYLLKLLEPRAPCPACGRSDADRDPVVVRACQLVLDRSGFGPHATMEVVKAETSHEETSLDSLIERHAQLGVLIDHLKKNAEMEEQLALTAGAADAVDGYLVPEGDEPDPPAEEPIPLEFGTPEERTDDK